MCDLICITHITHLDMGEWVQRYMEQVGRSIRKFDERLNERLDRDLRDAFASVCTAFGLHA